MATNSITRPAFVRRFRVELRRARRSLGGGGLLDPSFGKDFPDPLAGLFATPAEQIDVAGQRLLKETFLL